MTLLKFISTLGLKAFALLGLQNQNTILEDSMALSRVLPLPASDRRLVAVPYPINTLVGITRGEREA